METGWVFRLKDKAKTNGLKGEYYFTDDESHLLTKNVGRAYLIENKEKEIEFMKAHEKKIIEDFGINAICNRGYRNMISNFDFVEVEYEDVY